MRSGGTFNVTSRPAEPTQPHSAWHSPVPYLFGGLAAMLGLIAFALLILACSYWKLSGYLGGADGAADRESGSGDDQKEEALKGPNVFEKNFLVIMPGCEKPTCLATPMSSRASSFEGNKSHGGEAESTGEKKGVGEKPKQGSGDPVGTVYVETHEALAQNQ